ncbi:XRE family transcriptional regulator [Sesbania bispinosa]|nr:XRE family transcriptional regulator [Sesbania bispinosa]
MDRTVVPQALGILICHNSPNNYKKTLLVGGFYCVSLVGILKRESKSPAAERIIGGETKGEGSHPWRCSSGDAVAAGRGSAAACDGLRWVQQRGREGKGTRRRTGGPTGTPATADGGGYRRTHMQRRWLQEEDGRCAAAAARRGWLRAAAVMATGKGSSFFCSFGFSVPFLSYFFY